MGGPDTSTIRVEETEAASSSLSPEGAGRKPITYELALVRGRSRTIHLVVAAGATAQHVIVGSSCRCDWRVAARGVRSRHFRLTFSKRRLSIEDRCEAGSVHVDGLCVGGRLELPCAARIDFGEAAIAVRILSRRSPIRGGAASLRAVGEGPPPWAE